MTASDPGAGKRALILFALALGGFAIGSTEFSAMSLLPFYARELGLSEPVAAHAISAYALGVVAGAPLLAFLGAGLPRRRLLVGLMIAIAAGNALTVWAPTYGWLLASRFVSGLPHGAYFGVAALMAASVMPNRRAQSVALVMLGLTLATIIGSPAANFIGLTIGWRWGFAIVVVLALLTALSVQLFAPLQRPEQGRDPKSELSALANTQVWLTLGAGAIGFGGMFAVYSFIAPLMTEGMGVSADMVPVILVVFGVGMTVGNLGAGWLADRAMKRTAVGLLVWSAICAGRAAADDRQSGAARYRLLCHRAGRGARPGAADAADGCRGGGADARRLFAPRRLQRRQCAGSVPCGRGDHRGLWLDGVRLGRQPARAGRPGDPARVFLAGAAARVCGYPARALPCGVGAPLRP